MTSTAARRRRLWILALAGSMALAILATFIVAYWDVALALWRARQLDGAATQAEAAPWLEHLWADSLRPRARQAVVDQLGPGRPRLTLWVFSRLEAQGDNSSAFAALLGKRLERDEELLGMWCHYLRWRQGAALTHCLDAWSPAPGAEDEGSTIVCGTMVDRSAFVQLRQTLLAARLAITPVAASHSNKLRALALAWFVGMAPLPGLDDDPEQKLKDWLAAYGPFLRETPFDSALGRCKRAEALPSMTPFAERGFPVPAVPFVGWKGPVPAIDELFGQSVYSETLIPPGALIDTNWRAVQGVEFESGTPEGR
jgi:hypothetical protein